MKRLICAVAAAAFLAGAAGPAGADTPDISGGYSGSVTDSAKGAGTLTLTLTQSGTAIAGNWAVAYAGSVNGGPLTATMAPDGSIQATATSAVPNACSLSLAGAMKNGALTGTLTGTGTGCTAETGTFTAQPATVHYTGTVTDSIAGAGALDFKLTQFAGFLSGTWSTTFSGASFLNGSGRAYGVLTGPTKMQLMLMSSTNSCMWNVQGSWTTTATITGSYAIGGCPLTDTGTYTVALKS